MNKIDIFVERLKKIGIEVEMLTNYPWIYLCKINNVYITERFKAEHGFTIAFHPIRNDEDLEITDIKEVFRVIRKYHLSDDKIYSVYMSGWNDSLNLADRKIFKNRMLQHAYNSGYIDYIVGDDIRSVDYQTKEEIISKIRNSI